MTAKAQKQINCPRCDGTGHIPEYFNIRDGLCFKCGGSGKVNAPRPLSANALAKKAAKQSEKEAARQIYIDEQNRKTRIAVERYQNDPRIPKWIDAEWIPVHCIQWAKYDRVWDTF